MRQQIAKETAERLEVANKEAWTRIYKAVKHFHEKLDTYGPGKRIHETLLPSLVSLCETLPMLNLSQDPALDTLASEVKDRLTTTSLDVLKDTPVARQDVAAHAARILQDIKSAGGIA